jgi:hypothetical protein
VRYDSSRNIERPGVVSIWLGAFSSAASFEAYLKEDYDSDDVPLSPFAADTELGFYDHDFLEAEFFEPAGDSRSMLAGMSYSSSYIDKAVERAKAVRGANAVFLLFDVEYRSSPVALGSTTPVTFIGTYPYDKTAARSVDAG